MLINRLLSAIIGVLLLSAVAASMAYRSAAKDVRELKNTNTQLTAEVATLEKQYKVMTIAYEELSATKFQIKKQTQTTIARIQKAPATDDDAVAPVLRQALEAIR